jgi:SAM-dependent methyltransferase
MVNEKELYERQFGPGKKLISDMSFPSLRKICFLRNVFEKYDLHRVDLAISLLNKGEKLLDVGCGDGYLAFKAKSKFQFIFGIDITPSQISEAKHQALKGSDSGLIFQECNLNEGIDFPDNFFDAVTCIATIEHIFDPYFVVGEIHRVLKDRGIFIAGVPNIAYVKHRICLLFGKLPVTSTPFNWKEICWDGGHLHYFTQKTFCNLLEECGFRILKVKGSGLFAKFRNFYPSLLTGDICVKAKKC